MGFKAHHEIEQKPSSNRMRAVVMSEFCVRDGIGPGYGIISAVDLEIGFNFLVDTFSFSVSITKLVDL